MNFRRLSTVIAFISLAAGRASRGQNVAEVQVAPATVSIHVGDRTGLLATAFDRIGNVIPTAKITWTSRSPQVAKVDANGTVTGLATGVAIIEAAAGHRTGLSTITVSPAPAAPAPAPAQTTAPASTPPPAPAEQPGVGALYGQPPGVGVATALRIIPAQVFLLPSENTRVAPRALKDDGSAAAPVHVTWQSLTPAIASVDANGTVVALSPGQGTIQVTSATGVTATAPVVVQQADLAIDQTGPIMMSPGDADTLHVIVPTQGNRAVSPLLLQWTSSVPTVATVTIDGVLRAVGPGDAVLSVAGLLQNRTVSIHVHKTVETLAVSPPRDRDVEIPLTASAKFIAHALAADNVAVPEAPLRWVVGDSSLASFDTTTGLLTGVKVGRTTLTVRGPGVGLQAVWNVSVIAGSLRLSTARVGLHAGARYSIKAEFTNDGGTVLGPAAGLTWTSDQPGVAAVGADGSVTAIGYGRSRITATAPGGKSASALVFVQGEILLASDRQGGKLHLFSLERSTLTDLRRVTADSGNEVEPAFSPDGSRIVFESTRDGVAQLYLMDADGTNRTRLTNRPQPDSRPVFTADGQTVVFQSPREGKRDGLEQIWTVGLDGTGLKMLTDSGGNRQAAVSPDGQTIAFISNRDNKIPHVWLMARDGSNQRPFIKGAGQREEEPHFLKDGSLEYLVQRRENGRDVTQVMKADLASGVVTPVSGTDLAIIGFAVAPAGDFLALLVNAEGRRGRLQVYVQPVGGGAAVPLPAAPNEQMLSPAFLPQP